MDIEEVVIEETYYERRRTESTGASDKGEFVETPERSQWDAEYSDFDSFEVTEERDFDQAEIDRMADECREWASHNQEIGARGEMAAIRYLERVGYRVIERNWSCPFGEADIIALDDETLVFIEVKTRTGISKGFPSEAVDARKRSRYEKIAAWYLKDYAEVDIPVRFDVIALLVVSPRRAFMKHYVNAFGVES